MTKPTKWHVHPAKTQISLGIRPVWSESSQSAWRKLGSTFVAEPVRCLWPLFGIQHKHRSHAVTYEPAHDKANIITFMDSQGPSGLLHMDRVKRIWYLSPMQAAKVQASLRISAVLPEPSLLAHTSSESRGTFRQKARSLAPLNGWAYAIKICHDGMLEDTNSLDGAHMDCEDWLDWADSHFVSFVVLVLWLNYVKHLKLVI